MNKHIICVQDLSCFGKCSLTITIPVLCSAGIQVTPLPTSLLSAHTGGLGNPWIHELTEDMKQIREHWNTLSFPIDAIYSGYVSNEAQLQEIAALFSQYPNAYRFVDPVMGDHGKLYASLPEKLSVGMHTLCQKAGCITPNMTEAYALLQEPYREGPYTKAEIERVLHKLYDDLHTDIILTGVYLKHTSLGCALYEKGTIHFLMDEYLPYHYHGTGDLFASALLGAYLQNHSLQESCRIAMTFTSMCMKYSFDRKCDERYGLQFETLLPFYIQQCFPHK